MFFGHWSFPDFQWKGFFYFFIFIFLDLQTTEISLSQFWEVQDQGAGRLFHITPHGGREDCRPDSQT